MSVFLQTERLVLRDREPRDLEFLASLYADPRVMRYIGDGVTLDRGEVEARYARVDAMIVEERRERWDGFKILERKADGVPIGQAGILRCEIDGAPEIEIGWWLAPFAWRNGYATEAASALRDFASRELGLDHLVVVLHAENTGSVAVAKRIGGADPHEVTYRNKRVTCYPVTLKESAVSQCERATSGGPS